MSGQRVRQPAHGALRVALGAADRRGGLKARLPAVYLARIESGHEDRGTGASLVDFHAKDGDVVGQNAADRRQIRRLTHDL